jgi:hypothetical protein
VKRSQRKKPGPKSAHSVEQVEKIEAESDKSAKGGESGVESPALKRRDRVRDPQTGRLTLREGQACIGSRLDDALEEKIVGFIASGMSWIDSCRLCDLDAATPYRWKQKGEEQPGSRYALFLERINKAETACKAIWVRNVSRSDDWRSICIPAESEVAWRIRGTYRIDGSGR